MKIKDRKWEMTDTIVGMKPKFRVVCGDCFRSALLERYRECENGVCALSFTLNDLDKGRFDMFLREVHCTKLTSVSAKAHANNMHYKCNECDRVKVFGVPIDEEFYHKLRQRRGGKDRFIPVGQWYEDEDKRKQLEGLGYV